MVTTLLAALGVGTAQAADPAAADTQHDGADQRPHDTNGTYRLDSGEYLTLLRFSGWSAVYELEGYQVGLIPDGEDRFVARDDSEESLTVVRDSDGEVAGIVMDRSGEPEQFAVRQELFEEETVTFSAGDTPLAGTLLLPEGKGPHPAVVVVHGAEFGTRDVYRLLGTHFARRGVATLIYDKRGTGESAGSFSEATFDDLTGDALAAVGLLKGHPSIDHDRIGLAGFSQGGWIIAMAAEQSDDVAFLVAVSSSGLSPGTSAAWLSGNLLSLRGFDERSIETARRGWGMMYSTLQLVDAGVMPSMPNVPGFWFHALDPYLDSSDLWSRVHQPVLGIWGETDCQVPARDSVDMFRDALRAGGNTAYTLRVLPGASHGLALVDACAHEMGGMHSHGSRFRYAPGYFTIPAEWIVAGPDDSLVELPEQSTASPLDWHQDPSMDVPWYGTFLPQAAIIALLILVFTTVSLTWAWRATFGRSRVPEQNVSTPRLRGGVAVFGLAATLLGGVALAELLLLGDVHTDFLIGGPFVAGRSPLSTAASVLAWTTVALAAALVFSTARKWVRTRTQGVRATIRWQTVTMVPAVLLF
ncbi:MAG TPA: alpha/beta hydrolase, partial [Acidimicrobiia bacterium]|nr:alpha/beta hydrolase [Acidimicrobiia bacterium]